MSYVTENGIPSVGSLYLGVEIPKGANRHLDEALRQLDLADASVRLTLVERLPTPDEETALADAFLREMAESGESGEDAEDGYEDDSEEDAEPCPHYPDRCSDCRETSCPEDDILPPSLLTDLVVEVKLPGTDWQVLPVEDWEDCAPLLRYLNQVSEANGI